MVRAFTSGIANGICREILASKHKTRALPGVEDKFFTPHGIYFIGNPHHINKLWILEKPLLKPKRVHIHKMTPKPMVQSPWSKSHGDIISSKPIVQVHGTTSHFRLMIQAHESLRGTLGVVVWRAKKYV